LTTALKWILHTIPNILNILNILLSSIFDYTSKLIDKAIKSDRRPVLQLMADIYVGDRRLHSTVIGQISWSRWINSPKGHCFEESLFRKQLHVVLWSLIETLTVLYQVAVVFYYC